MNSYIYGYSLEGEAYNSLIIFLPEGGKRKEKKINVQIAAAGTSSRNASRYLGFS